MAAVNEMAVNEKGILVNEKGDAITVSCGSKDDSDDVIFISVEKCEDNDDVTTEILTKKYMADLAEIDKTYHSDEDFEEKKVYRNYGGRPRALKRQKERKSNTKGVAFERGVVDHQKFVEECEAIFAFHKTKTNIHPKGTNARRELPRKAKLFYVHHNLLFKMKTLKGKRKYTNIYLNKCYDRNSDMTEILFNKQFVFVGIDVQVIWQKKEQDNVLEYLHSGKGQSIQSQAIGGHLGILYILFLEYSYSIGSF